MEISNWFEFLLYTLFTLGVVFMLVPLGINFTFTGIKLLVKNGRRQFADQTVGSKLASGPLELIFVGLFALTFSIWYLFFDAGGHVLNYPIEVINQYHRVIGDHN